MKNILFTLVLFSFLFVSCRKEDKAVYVDYLVISVDSVFLKGKIQKLECEIAPYSASNKTVFFVSSNENVIQIKGDTAIAINIGSAIITAKSTDGSEIQSSKKIQVYDRPHILISSISDINYFSAKITLQFENGGDSKTFNYGLVWDTIPLNDTIINLGRSNGVLMANTISVDMFNDSQKYYVRAYAKNRMGTTLSSNEVFTTPAIPKGLTGNYMLNNPLAWGLVVKYNDWIYFNNFKDNNSLYKIKTDLSQCQKVSSIAGVRSLSVIGPFLYFTGDISSGYSKIMRMKLDGTSLYNYIEGDYYCKSWGAALILENFIYPSNGFFRISVDGKEKLPNKGFNQYINVYNGKLYFCKLRVNNSDSLYSINCSNIDGSAMQELYRGYNPYIYNGNYLGIYENAAYFKENDLFKKFDLSSPNVITTLPIKPYFYNIVNNTIFFSNNSDGKKLYKSGLDGQLSTKLCDDIVSGISIIDEWLYYYNISDNKLYRIKHDGSGRELVY